MKHLNPSYLCQPYEREVIYYDLRIKNLCKLPIAKTREGILLPVLLYACTTNLSLTNTQLSKLLSLDRRLTRLATKRQTPI